MVDLKREEEALDFLLNIYEKCPTAPDTPTPVFAEEFQSLFQGDGFDALVGRQLGKLWLVLVVGCTYLNHRTEAAYLHEHRATALRVVA